MKKKLSIMLVAVASLFAMGMYAENNTSVQVKQNTTETQQVQQVPCAPETYCGPQTCVANQCYTDTTCYGTAANPVPCAPAPCVTDSVNAPVPCAPVPCAPVTTPAPAIPTTGCGGC